MKLFLTLILSATILTGISPTKAGIVDSVKKALDVFSLESCPIGTERISINERNVFGMYKSICCPYKRIANLHTCCPEGTIAAGRDTDIYKYCYTPKCAEQTNLNKDLCPCGGEYPVLKPTVGLAYGKCCKNGYAFKDYDPFYGNSDPIGVGDYTEEDQICCEAAGKEWKGGKCGGCSDGESLVSANNGEQHCCPVGNVWIDE